MYYYNNGFQNIEYMDFSISINRYLNKKDVFLLFHFLSRLYSAVVQ